ncbi:MAG: hydroxyacid dehydrogenase [Planctomycetes bacterium]|nr:hydroxyacid dehydrogenase [Planctomycetota bacterium]
MPDEKPKIVVAEHIDDAALERLRDAGEVQLLDAGDESSLIRALADADALVVRSYTNVTASVIRAGKRLRVIGRGGVGLENIDLQAARAQGVTVVYTPAAATEAVAEHTVGLMLALERHLLTGDAMVRDHRFEQARSSLLSRDLRDCTLGVVGMGRIGTAVARICHAGLNMPILYNDIRDIDPLPFSAEAVDKDTLYAGSDVVTLHVPLTEQTRGLINSSALNRFKADATLINTARGAVVDAEALAEALRMGRLGGAAIDVFDPEPPPKDHPLLSSPSVLLSPHIAARTKAGLARMNDVVDDVVAVLEGRAPSYPA